VRDVFFLVHGGGGGVRAVFSALSALVLQSDCVLSGLNPERNEGVAAPGK